MTTQPLEKEALDYLALSCYEFNRELKPEISIKRWELVFGAEMVAEMEAKFQAKKLLTIDV